MKNTMPFIPFKVRYTPYIKGYTDSNNFTLDKEYTVYKINTLIKVCSPITGCKEIYYIESDDNGRYNSLWADVCTKINVSKNNTSVKPNYIKRLLESL